MKISPNTITILKNFANINPSIVVKSGNILSTISPNKTIIAKAVVPDTFNNKFGIYNLGRFISCLSLISNPDLEFNENYVTIKGDGHSIQYHFADPSVILTPPEKDIKLPEVDVECSLSNKDLQNVIKALGILALPEVVIAGNGNKILLQAADSKNSSIDIYSIEIGETDRVFRAIFKSENLKMIDDNYNVKISSKGISQFIGNVATYFIAVESTSTF
jgi:hypothetical protein